jgi:mRNA interferase HigB
VRVISRKALREFWEKHPDAEQPLRAWFREASAAGWRSPAEIRQRFPSASFVGKDRVVFNIKGNAYRLIVAVRYDLGLLLIRFVGKHADYDRVDASTV